MSAGEFRVVVRGTTVLTTNVRGSALTFADKRGGVAQQLLFGEWHTIATLADVRESVADDAWDEAVLATGDNRTIAAALDAEPISALDDPRDRGNWRYAS